MDTLLIIFLTLLNGAFAMSELALASSRKARLAAMAEAGDKGSITALKLLENPTQFLSSVQVGITSIGMLNGIVGEAAFSDDLGMWVQTFGLAETTANVIATVIVVVVITFITIVFGELVPKRIGQLYPETVSRWVSRPMAWVARIARPFVSLLSATTSGVLALLRVRVAARTQHEEGEQVRVEELEVPAVERGAGMTSLPLVVATFAMWLCMAKLLCAIVWHSPSMPVPLLNEPTNSLQQFWRRSPATSVGVWPHLHNRLIGKHCALLPARRSNIHMRLIQSFE